MSRFKAPASSLSLPPPPRPGPLAVIPRVPTAPATLRSFVPRLATGANPIHKIGFAAAAAYVTMQYAFLNDLLGIVGHIYIPLAYIFGPPALLAALLGGRLGRVFQTRVGYFVLGIYVCLLASVPFSLVRSRSLFMLKDVLITGYGVFFIVAALAATLAQVRLLMHVIAWSAILDVFVTSRMGAVDADGRMSFAGGSMANANDFALHLLVAVPFCLLYVLEKGRPKVVKLIMIGASAAMVYYALQSGSRAAVLCLAVIGLFGVWKASFSQRVAIAVFTFTALAALPFLAPQTWVRLAGSFDSAATRSSSSASSAHLSSVGRLDLLRRSIEVTLRHPLFGVGVGEFQDAEAGIASDEGVRAHWQVTHNAYTQISSEAGIPALICFAGAVFGAIRLSLRIYQRARRSPQLQNLALMTFNLTLAMVCLACAMFFDSLCYSYYVPMLAGLSVALWNASQSDLRAAGV